MGRHAQKWSVMMQTPILGKSSEEEEEKGAEGGGLTHPSGTASGAHSTFKVPRKRVNVNVF